MTGEQKRQRRLKLNGNIIGIAIILGVFIFVLCISYESPVENHRDYNSCNCYSSSGSSGHAFATSVASAYHVTSDDLKNAVFAYASDHNGSFPILDSTYTNICCQNCSVINISAVLVANGGLLRMAPESCHLSATGNDNCGGNASLGCKGESSYIWLINTNGSVFSYCAGAGCVTNNTCYQGVWP